MGFGQGLSGLKAASQNLDVIGNNIANSATVGFKASTIAFADVYANSRVGLGVQVASVDQRFTTGNLSITGNQFDMAIDGDKGFFRLVDNSGAVMYSRNGQFHADKDYNIVNAQGQRLTGYMANDDGVITDQLTAIKVPVGNMEPQATTAATVRANFDSRSSVIDSAAINAENVSEPENHTHSLPMTVYDSLGNPHQLTQYFVKVAPDATTPPESSKWKVYYAAERPLEIAVGTLEDGVFSGDAAGNPQELTFDATGRLDKPEVGVKVGIKISNIGQGAAAEAGPPAIPEIPADSPAADIVMGINYTGSTQFGGEFTPSFTQNGYSTGEYSSMEIASNGDILANYTNGETKIMGAIALADFNNLNGLQPIGGNAWIATSASGEALLGRPGANGLATLKGQSVEESNVDMSEELVNMIIAQRTYQANAQTIKTQDQILQTLITLR